MEAAERAFREHMSEFGYVHGNNLAIEWRFASGSTERYTEFAAELVKLNVDCIVTNGVDSTIAAKLATHSIPIVMHGVNDDPVRRGLVASLARPGGNVTGWTQLSADLTGKRLQLLKEVMPNLGRVAILWDPNSVTGTGHVKETEAAGRTLRIQVQSLPVGEAAEFEKAFSAAARERAQALVVVATGMMNSHRPRITSLAVKYRLAAVYSNAQFVLAGGLMSYAGSAAEQWYGAATYVSRILKGTKPAELPVQQPTRFEFVINAKAAKQIGLTIPPSVLARADKVIE